jgi:hypothetical protein
MAEQLICENLRMRNLWIIKKHPQITQINAD